MNVPGSTNGQKMCKSPPPPGQKRGREKGERKQAGSWGELFALISTTNMAVVPVMDESGNTSYNNNNNNKPLFYLPAVVSEIRGLQQVVEPVEKLFHDLETG